MVQLTIFFNAENSECQNMGRGSNASEMGIIYSTPVRRRYILYPRPPKNTEVYGLLPTVCNVTFERFIFKAFFFAEIAGTELG